MTYDRKAYRDKNRERINKREAEYRRNNPQIISRIQKKYRETHKEQIKKGSQRAIWFKDKKIFYPANPRINVCSNCSKRYPEDLKSQTVIHHTHYNSLDPLEDTIELCKRCHGKLHRGVLNIDM